MISEKDIIQESRIGNNVTVDFMGIKIDALDMQQTVDLVEQYIISKTPLHLVGVNADKIMEMKKNELLNKIVNSCGVINADGASVILASKFLGKPLPVRVAGVDLMQNLVEMSCKKGYTIFLLGAKKSVVEKTSVILETEYPELIITGIHDGYFKEEDWPSISKMIKDKKPDIVFVGITSPLKEYLVEYLQNDGNNCVFMGVGGSFDVISGNIPRAPIWMQKLCLEWLFRVAQEPKRLFKRYFVSNWQFIGAVLAEKIRKKDGENA